MDIDEPFRCRKTGLGIRKFLDYVRAQDKQKHRIWGCADCVMYKGCKRDTCKGGATAANGGQRTVHEGAGVRVRALYDAAPAPSQGSSR